MDIVRWYKQVAVHRYQCIYFFFVTQILTNALLEQQHVSLIQHARTTKEAIPAHVVVGIRETGKLQDALVYISIIFFFVTTTLLKL